MTREHPKELRWRIVYMLRPEYEGNCPSSSRRPYIREKDLFDTNQNIKYRPRPGKLRRLSGELWLFTYFIHPKMNRKKKNFCLS
jgi:hypothetical protein